MALTQTRINQAAVIRIVGARVNAAAERAAQAGAQRVRQNIIADGLINTGAMLRGVIVRPSPLSTPLRKRYEIVSTSRHTIFPEKGTRGSQARPGGVLVFRPKGASGLVFAKRTRGVPAHHFMARAKAEIRRKDFLP
jgi:hypothetical protein